ncbi:MAG: SIMPL domain-containing protein [Patescibacteria group bacterium]
MFENDSKIAWSPKFVLILVAIILLAGIIVISILRDRIVNPQFRSVTITGQGKVSYSPDLAIITLGVQIDKIAKPEEALNQLNTKVASIIKAVNAVGISSDDIQTQNYSLYPQYDYKDNVSSVTGYNANEQLVIKVKNYDKNSDNLGKIIAAASKAGANQVNNLSFDSSRLNDLKQEARVKAINDAKEKSSALAMAAGVQLKDISGWYENLVQPLPYVTDMSAKGGMGGGGGAITPSMPTSDREVIIEIGVTYNLK